MFIHRTAFKNNRKQKVIANDTDSKLPGVLCCCFLFSHVHTLSMKLTAFANKQQETNHATVNNAARITQRGRVKPRHWTCQWYKMHQNTKIVVYWRCELAAVHNLTEMFTDRRGTAWTHLNGCEEAPHEQRSFKPTCGQDLTDESLNVTDCSALHYPQAFLAFLMRSLRGLKACEESRHGDLIE